MTSHPDRKYVLFIESNTSGSGADFIGRTHSLGLVPVLVTSDFERYQSIGFPPVRVIRSETEHVEPLLKALEVHQIRTEQVAAVLSSGDSGVLGASLLAQRLGLIGPDPSGIDRARNKLAARRTLENTSLNPWFDTADALDVEALLERFPHGIVLKPQRGTGSIGVKVIKRSEEAATLPKVLTDYIVEEYVPGSEYSVEFVGGTMLGVCQKSTNGRGLELGHVFPAPLPESAITQLKTAGQLVIEEFGLENTSVHLEFVRDSRDSGIKLIEVNPRLAGGRIPDLIRLATNVDPITETLQVATGRGTSTTTSVAALRSAAIRFLVPERAGTLLPESVSQAWNSVAVVDVELYRNRLAPSSAYGHGDFRDRKGHIICVATTPERASAHCATAQSHIRWTDLAEQSASTDDARRELARWTRTHSRSTLILCRGTEPHHVFLSNRLADSHDIVREIVDLNLSVAGRTPTTKLINRVARQYHGVRRVLMRSRRTRQRQFAAPSYPRNTHEIEKTASLRNARPNIFSPDRDVDLIILKGCGVLPGRTLRSTEAQVANIHGGWLPNYRGNHCYFYAYYHVRPERFILGSTLHMVTEKIDDGQIIDRSRLFSDEPSTVEHAYCLGELICFERLLRRLSFPDFLTRANKHLDVRNSDAPVPASESRLYLTRHRYIHQDIILGLKRKFRKQMRSSSTTSTKSQV